MSASVAHGGRERSSAAIPATTGVAPDVPQPAPKPPPSCVVGAHAGAATFTQSPRLEQFVSRPSSAVAPTDRTGGYAAGYSRIRPPSLPAAATTTTPAA